MGTIVNHRLSFIHDGGCRRADCGCRHLTLQLLVVQQEAAHQKSGWRMGLQARLMSQALRKLTGAVSKSKTCLIFINQRREKIGVMFGNPETTTGGRALKFYPSVRIDIRRIASIKDGDAVIGGRTRLKIVKNKVAPLFRRNRNLRYVRRGHFAPRTSPPLSGV